MKLPARSLVRGLGCLLVALVCPAVRAQAGAPLFPGPTFEVDGFLYLVYVADMNGDGRQDFVCDDLPLGHGVSGSLTVLLADGNGRFVRRDRSYASLPGGLALGDLDGDGRLDVVSANTFVQPVPGFVAVLHGDGAGGFGPETGLACGGEPRQVALGDVNGDGELDVLVQNGAVFLANGLGGFGPKGDSGLRGGFALADWNADGKLDAATRSGAAPAVSIRIGNGLGSFGAGTDFPVAGAPDQFLVADLSADGKPDLVSANRALGVVSVLLGNGAGGFGASSDHAASGPTGAHALGDLNGDGATDIVLGVTNTNGIALLPGDGTGSFGAPLDVQIGTEPGDLAVGDWNGDGRPDLATSISEPFASSELLLLHGRPGGGLGLRLRTSSGFGPDDVTSFALGDLSGDGALDVVMASDPDDVLGVGRGDRSGGFDAPTRIAVGDAPGVVALTDLNDDGKRDLVTLNRGLTQGLTLLRGDGLGGFARTDVALDGFLNELAVCDLDENGARDLLVSRPGGTVALLGDGLGGFGPGVETGLFSVFVMAAGDLDTDGRLDLATVDRLGSVPGVNLVHVLSGDGTGRFGAERSLLDLGDYPYSCALGDLDDDGHLDLLVSTISELAVLPGDGRGNLGPRIDYPSAAGSIRLADLNGDGELDVLSGGGSVSLGAGKGVLRSPLRFDCGSEPVDVESADVDVDGRLDLVTVDRSSGELSVLLNQREGSASATRRNGLGDDELGYRSLNLPVLGTIWRAEVRTSPRRGSHLTAILGTDRPLAGRPTAFGELLIDLTAPRVFTSLEPSRAGVALHSRTIPNLLALADRPIFTQAVVLDPARFCNAIDLVLGR